MTAQPSQPPTCRTWNLKTEAVCCYCKQPLPIGEVVVRTDRGGIAHLKCRERRDVLLTSSEIAAELGLSPAQFLKLARTIPLAPEAHYDTTYTKNCPLWPPELVETLRDSELVISARTRRVAAREAKARKAVERQERLQVAYPDWRDALPIAAEALFNLNRYAKWERCSSAHRDEIYALKSELIRLLYEQGYAVQVRQHHIKREGLKCWDCGGYGCERCNNTGWYRKRDKIFFIAFRFQIGERSYSWHQPKREVKFPYTLTPVSEAETQDWQPEYEKPIEMAPKDFADAKAVIRYVIEVARANQGA